MGYEGPDSISEPWSAFASSVYCCFLRINNLYNFLMTGHNGISLDMDIAFEHHLRLDVLIVLNNMTLTFHPVYLFRCCVLLIFIFALVILADIATDARQCPWG